MFNAIEYSHFHRAILFGNAGKMNEAISVLNTVIQTIPTLYLNTYLNLGQAYRMRGEFIKSGRFKKQFELQSNYAEGMQINF